MSESERLPSGQLPPWLPAPALCLSGGGYRAVFFHLGAIWRLNEAGLLPRLGLISGVSTGGLLAAWLGLRWRHLRWDSHHRATNLTTAVIEPLLPVLRPWIGIPNMVLGGLTAGRGSLFLLRSLRRIGFGRQTCDAFPAQGHGPRIVLGSTNLRTAARFWFDRDGCGDGLLGRFGGDPIEVAVAVAGTAAFPPTLSPLWFDLRPFVALDQPPAELAGPPFTSQALLADGGILDNLAVQAAAEGQPLLISDGGYAPPVVAWPRVLWSSQMFRVVQLIQHDNRELRRRILVDQRVAGERDSAFWSISDSAEGGPLAVEAEATRALAVIPSRMGPQTHPVWRQLVNLGYVLSAASLVRDWPELPSPEVAFPYPEVGVRLPG